MDSGRRRNRVGNRSHEVEVHHVIPRSRGGSDDVWNLSPLSTYEHAEQHAIDYVLFEHAPQFDYRLQGWGLLPLDLREAVLLEHSRRLKKNNPFKDPTFTEKALDTKRKNGSLEKHTQRMKTNNPSSREDVKAKKAETFERNGTHNFKTPEGRELNSIKATERNNALNRVRCSCVVCHKEVSYTNFSRHFNTHLSNNG